MKTSLLLVLSFILTFNVYSQNYPFKLDKTKLRIEQIPGKDKTTQTKQHLKPLPEKPIPDRDVNIVSIIDIGTAANAYTYWKKLSYLWVDPELNTIINIHRRGGALDLGVFSGDLAYDISKDGGQTWQITNQIYDAYLIGWQWMSARYPQTCIYNPNGSSNPNDTYVSYFAPGIEGSLQLWGYVHGVGSIGDTSYHTQNLISSDDRFYENVPEGFDINSDGNIFVIDKNMDITGDIPDYRDSLIISKGIWNTDLEDFTYERESLEALVEESLGAPADYKVAFEVDGQTGYIVIIANNGEAEQIEGFNNLYPIFWKTTNGGETWGQPNYIQLDGPNGINNIIYHHLTDELIAELFENPPPRDEISYTTAYDCDIAVDDNGDLHIAVVIGPTGSDPYSIIAAEGYLAAVDIFTSNGGLDWSCEEMGRIKTFRGDFGDLTQDNRIQITTTPDADLIFISWLDTDMEDAEENDRPNIWVRGFNPSTYLKTHSPDWICAPTNVTLFSDGMWEAFLGTAPKYCFEFETGEYTIPYVYVEMNPDEPIEEIQFKYITDFKFMESDFVCTVGVEEQISHKQPLKVLGNSPNPFNEETNIQIELNKPDNVNVIVFSTTGQQLFETDFGRLNQGRHNLTLQLPNQNAGVYFYTVEAGQHRITSKMILK